MSGQGAWQAHWSTILARLQLVADAAEAQRLVAALVNPARPTVLGFVNAHAMNLAANDPAYAQALGAADLLLRDGSGMALMLRRLHREPGLNMNGTDFIPQLLEACRGRRVAFWGTREPWLSEAVRCCEARHGLQAVSVIDGFADSAVYTDAARRLQPQLIVLGMGMPRQELLAVHLAALGNPCLIVCGGAILDFLGGKVSRAPLWLRRIGCEWLYRLLSEPRRLFRRYVQGNPLFMWRTWCYQRDRPR